MKTFCNLKHGGRTVIQPLAYILLRALLAIFSWLPLSMLHAFARFFGELLCLFPNRMRETTRKNLETCFPDRSSVELDLLMKESLVHTAATALEMGKAWVAPLPATLNLVRGSEGLAAFNSAVEGPRGVILLAPHLSNWEVFGFFASEGRPSNFMYQPPQNAGLDKLLRRVRSRNGVNLAPTSRKGVAKLLSALKRGEMVGILPDQVPADAGGAFSDFYGQPALTMTLVSKLIQRTDALVFCGFAERLPKGKGFMAVFEPADEAIYSANLQESLKGLNRSVESLVNRSLPQYQWEYKRFRRRLDNSEFY